MVYDRVILVGSGKIACDCVRAAAGYTQGVLVLEQAGQGLSAVKHICMKNGLEYRALANKSDMTAFFSGIREKTLVVSANNNYIFPGEILSMGNLSIVNWFFP